MISKKIPNGFGRADSENQPLKSTLKFSIAKWTVAEK